ncbi:MAG: FtsH protease activity modulator HflK [Oscillospiraceae bacterium]|nr:FtsH protease activity modulator HflK [Oscillospiraceae bacterium]
MTAKQAKRTLRGIIMSVIVLAVIILAANSIYTIAAQEQAVVMTLGRPHVVDTPGLHMKIPFIQQAHIVSMEIMGLSIGYQSTGGGYAAISQESMMITSDYNIVNVDFYLQYRVSHPDKFLFATDDPVAILRNMALSYIRDTIGLHEVDVVITTGKNEIQAEIREKLSRRLVAEDIGLQLVNITIQDSVPPTAEVTEAFKNVENARQDKETAINTARKYENEQIPAARAQVNAIEKTAESQREARINEAIGQVAVFNAMFEEYLKHPRMTRQRMFYEAMEDILPGLKIVIDSGDGQTTRILPLDAFSDQDMGAAASSLPRSNITGTEGAAGE